MRRLALWAAGRGPDPSFAAMVFWCCDRVLSPQLCRTKASCKRTRACWQLAVQKGRQSQGLELVSGQFRMRRLALWAASRGPDPSFAAMVFWCCDRFLSPQLCKTKASCKRTRARWQLAVQKGRQSQGLELVSRQFRKRRLALWAAGRGPDPSFAAMVFWCCDRVLSPQLCRTKASCKRTQARWQLAVQKGRQSQGLELVSRQFRMRCLALWAAGRGPDPSFAAMVFWCCDTWMGGCACKYLAQLGDLQVVYKYVKCNL